MKSKGIKAVLAFAAMLVILLCAALSVNAEGNITDYLTFSSDGEFTLATYNSTKSWDGVLYYSTDLNTWNEWDGASTLSSASGKLYMAGVGNTKITGVSSESGWVLTGEDISCDGNIEALLDFETVAEGKHPTMADYCYFYMFQDCTSLVNAPSLPAETLAYRCYNGMFYGCTGLTEMPNLPATTLADYCYQNMFYDCTGIKLSATRTPEYRIPWSIPVEETAATGWSTDMFSETGGTFTGDPEIGVTYYVAATEPITDYLTFSSDNEFTLATYNSTKNWDGALFYSTDLSEWKEWDGGEISSVSGRLYMLGMGNTRITGALSECRWVLT